MSKNKTNDVIKLEDVVTFENLLKAYIHCRKGKRFRAATVLYHLNYLANLYKLKKELLSGKYKIRGLYTFIIYEPKKRYITANHFEDKIVQRLICKEVLEPAISKMLIYDNYASQPKKGTHIALERLQHFLRSYVKEHGTDDGFILSIDIKKYFYMIDQTVCLNFVYKLPIDDKLYKLIEMQIRTYDTLYNEYTDEPNRGLCIGFQTSQWLSIYYLNELDHIIKEKLHIKYYGRYVDDLIIIHHDKEYLKYCLSVIEKYVNDKLNLELNSKTHIYPMSQGVCFLGYRCVYNHDTHRFDTFVRNKAIRRMQKRASMHKDLIALNKMQLSNALDSLRSWRSHAEYGLSEHAENVYNRIWTEFTETEFYAEEFYHLELSDPSKVDRDGFYILQYTDEFRDQNGFQKLIKRVETLEEYRHKLAVQEVKNHASEYVYKNFHELLSLSKRSTHKTKKKIHKMSKRKLQKVEKALDDFNSALEHINIDDIEN